MQILWNFLLEKFASFLIALNNLIKKQYICRQFIFEGSFFPPHSRPCTIISFFQYTIFVDYLGVLHNVP